MKKYVKTNDTNWRKLCKGIIRCEQQSMKLEDKKQLSFELKDNNKN